MSKANESKTKESKGKQLKAKPLAELQTELESLLKAQFSLRMQQATQQLSNNRQLRTTRRDIARVRTVITQHQQEQS